MIGPRVTQLDVILIVSWFYLELNGPKNIIWWDGPFYRRLVWDLFRLVHSFLDHCKQYMHIVILNAYDLY